MSVEAHCFITRLPDKEYAFYDPHSHSIHPANGHPDRMSDHWDIAVIGNGPSGYSAAVYGAATTKLSVIHFTGMGSGGQISSPPYLDNWPREPGPIKGEELIHRMRVQTSNLDNLLTAPHSQQSASYIENRS